MRILDECLNYDENNDVGEVDWAFAGFFVGGWRFLVGGNF